MKEVGNKNINSSSIFIDIKQPFLPFPVVSRILALRATVTTLLLAQSMGQDAAVHSILFGSYES
jgi:hypothetical protein